MARARSPYLQCHQHTAWVSYEIHHIDPMGMGGKDVLSNRIPVCCNTHSDTHLLMNRLLAAKPVDLREYNQFTRDLAHRGAAAVMARWEPVARALTAQSPTPVG